MSKRSSLQNSTLHCAGAVLWLAVLFVPSADVRAQRLPKARLTGGLTVRTAFKAAVSGVSGATVRITTDGSDAALGAVVDPDGWILTKASELTGRVVCRFKDGRELPARIVGVHQDFDLAMLKVDTQGLSPVAWSKGGDPRIGSWLATTGPNDVPIGVGVLSVKRRRIAPERGVLGITIEESKPGPRVTKVFSNSGAEKAGLKTGDVIIRVADRLIKTGSALTSRLRSLRPGDALTLRVLRGEKQLEVRATLGYPLTSVFNRGALQNRIGGALSKRRAGFPAALQHDTVLRPKDCGGPVVDLNGRVVGLNIARAGRTATYVVPTEVILPLLDDLKSGKLPPPVALTGPIGPAPPPLPVDVNE